MHNSISMTSKRTVASDGDGSQNRPVVPVKPKAGTAKATVAAKAQETGFDPSQCKTYNTDKEPTIVPGIQGAITAITQCSSSSPCSFSITRANTAGTTLSSSQSQSLTNSFDTSVAVSAGVMFPVMASTTVSIGYSLANTVSKDTGTSVSNSTEFSVQQGLNLEAGSSGYLSFTPTANCWGTSLDCGKGPVSGFQFCNPVMVGGAPAGQYSVVYVR